MKAETKAEIEIQLTLSEREAIWLMNYLQNYNAGPQGSEDPINSEVRSLFFRTLRDQLKK